MSHPISQNAGAGNQFPVLVPSPAMQVRFLLGPAGSGKTFRCLAEVRARLKAAPLGAPLILLAPKQATFQLERQLLADPELAGYTRLQLVSFDRLARFVLDELAVRPRELLDEEGRVMVLRALLARHQGALRLYRASALRPGLAGQISELLRELQRQRIAPGQLEAGASRLDPASPLGLKTRDLALLVRAYRAWLTDNGLEDSDQLLDTAAHELGRVRAEARLAGRDATTALEIEGLWLDGFAEMTPQELELLAGVLPFCRAATLAFCLDHEPANVPPWNSTWSVVGRSFCECRDRLAAVPEAVVERVLLERRAESSRFAAGPALAWLEANWSAAGSALIPGELRAEAADRVTLARCVSPEAEAVHAARAILRHVHGGGRFRETAVLVRSLDAYATVVRRVFTRYGIPFFLDQREPVAHHPLAELVRFALRLVAGRGQSEDWLGVLKTGLAGLSDEQVDELENAVLAHGWTGEAWWHDFPPGNGGEGARINRARARVVRPFAEFSRALAAPELTGAQLADALEDLWRALRVEQTLERWSAVVVSPTAVAQPEPAAIHGTVWRQMQEWLRNLRRAFPAPRAAGILPVGEVGDSCEETNAREPNPGLAFPLRDWLPIVEAGLNGLTVGVIPPAIDQVPIGAVDRSRNPDLRLALVLGLNEGVFPAAPARPVLLTEREREVLQEQGVALGHARAARGHERFLAYIACTRARERLVLSCAAADRTGRDLHPSIVLEHVGRLLALETLEVPAEIPPAEAWCAAEVLGSVLAAPEGAPLRSLATLPVVRPVAERWRSVLGAEGLPRLAPANVGALFGPEIRVSVSSLEQFAECPFKFFVARGLRLEEREEFEVGHRERGDFQHVILEAFHRAATADGGRWRALTPDAAAELITRIGGEQLLAYRGGLLNAEPGRRQQARALIANLAALVRAEAGWLRTSYAFEPRAAELAFGLPDAPLPEWPFELPGGGRLLLRGKVDRVDLCPAPDGRTLAVVVDYKSSGKKLEAWRLEHGLQLQLPFYLLALTRIDGVRELLATGELVAAGMFYIGLKVPMASVEERGEAVDAAAFLHVGRYAAQWQTLFDSQPGGGKSGQFKYAFTKAGPPARRGSDAVPEAEFSAVMAAAAAHVGVFGARIQSGDVAVAPFRKARVTACDYCEYRGICRFDPWTGEYRRLKKNATPTDDQ